MPGKLTCDPDGRALEEYLRTFTCTGEANGKGRGNREYLPERKPVTLVREIEVAGTQYPAYLNEFWTSRQRQGSSLHEVSYRACFKPQLPGFFIQMMTDCGDLVYDPFSGRGTTVLEAGLQGRKIAANDANPLSRILTEPRLSAPDPNDVRDRLARISRDGGNADLDLSMFYHPETESEIISLRNYLLDRKEEGTMDAADRWIAMVATNRLTGHSSGFFSVYTLPPNQAITPPRQKQINERLGQVPPYRDTHAIILKKTKSLLRTLDQVQRENLHRAVEDAVFLNRDARSTPEIREDSVQLTVTSPPFLDIVQYPLDNWLRCWFNGIDEKSVGKTITMARSVEGWCRVMGDVFRELCRVTQSGGWVAFEVGEVRKGTVRLDEHVIPLGRDAGFRCEGVLINTQQFTKTSHIWGVGNNTFGTNTNRIVIFSKP
ncbi:MAG: DNA methyltransferase [Methanoregulaceae archaeon]